MRSPTWPLALLAVLLAAVTGGACSSDGGSKADGAATETTVALDRSHAIVAAFVHGLLATAPESVTEADASCIATSVIGQVGEDEIVARGMEAKPDDTNALTPALRTAVLHAFTTCLTPEQQAQLGPTTDAGPTVSVDGGGGLAGDG